MTKKPSLWFDKNTGSIVSVKKNQKKRLPDHFKEIKFLKNDEGVDVMRFDFDGAVVDVSQNETIKEE